MKFFSSVISNRSGTRSTPGNADLIFFKHRPTKQSGDRIGFRISAQLCEQAGLKPGDRVDVGFDGETCMGQLLKVKSGGYGLSASGVLSKDLLSINWYPCTISITCRPSLPNIDSTAACSRVKPAKGSIKFHYPEDTAFPVDAGAECDAAA